MLSAVIITILIIMNEMDLNFSKAKDIIISSSYSDVFILTGRMKGSFKQFFSGAFIAIVMTGLDQDMMQKKI